MINTREIAEEYRLTHWAQIMQERAQSGLSIKDYCKQIGICQNTYFYWQRRVRAAACEQLMADTQDEPEINDRAVPNGWAVCEVSSGSGQEKVSVEVKGCRVLVSTDTDLELMAKVCKILLSLC